MDPAINGSENLTKVDDSILEDISQEYEKAELRGPLNPNLVQIFQELAWGIYQQEDLD